MARFNFNVFMLLSLLSIVTRIDAIKPLHLQEFSDFNRSSFPPGFVFGTASSSFQVCTNNHLSIYATCMQCKYLILCTEFHIFMLFEILVWRCSKRRWKRTKYMGYLYS